MTFSSHHLQSPLTSDLKPDHLCMWTDLSWNIPAQKNTLFAPARFPCRTSSGKKPLWSATLCTWKTLLYFFFWYFSCRDSCFWDLWSDQPTPNFCQRFSLSHSTGNKYPQRLNRSSNDSTRCINLQRSLTISFTLQVTPLSIYFSLCLQTLQKTNSVLLCFCMYETLYGATRSRLSQSADVKNLIAELKLCAR